MVEFLAKYGIEVKGKKLHKYFSHLQKILSGEFDARILEASEEKISFTLSSGGRWLDTVIDVPYTEVVFDHSTAREVKSRLLESGIVFRD